LDFSFCTGVTDLTPVWKLHCLRRLDLSGCGFAVPESLFRHLAALPELAHLSCDRGDKVPQEILSRHPYDNCLPRLRTHLAEIDQAAEAENEVKIILLGNGRVGKTQLCRRFRGLEPDDSPSTHGVQLWRKELRMRAGGEESAFQVNWWDFGGQDIYHGTHALFLRSRAVFLVLWTPALENREEVEENGIPLRNQPLAYWLDYVRSLAGSDSPVIVVQSQCDTFGEELPAPPRPEGIEFFRTSAYSAWTDLGRETLEGQVRDAIRYLREKSGAVAIGSGRAKARRRLYAMRDDDQALPPEERRHRTLSLDEFQTLCEEVGGIVSTEHALDYFHQTGVVFYRPDLFSQRILLDQTWALDAIYSVFDRRQTAPFLRDSGRFTRENLAYLAWGRYSESEQRLFLGLMESCGICFEHGKKFSGETEYVAPDLLPPFEAMARNLRAWQADRPTSTLRLDYRFFHQAIIRGLMSRIGRMAGQEAEYWRYGLWLYDRKREAQVLVRQIDTSTADAPGAGALEIQAQGRDALGLLREIRRSVFENRIGEEPNETLTIDGAVVARGELAHAIGGRVRASGGREIPAEPFSAFFEGREAERAESQGSDGREHLDLDPAPAPDPDRRPEVFISYAWGDDTPEGLQRAEVVDRLEKALEKTGFDVQRDRDAQRPGDLISLFIKRLGDGDRVVAVISEKYLHSVACMEEIYRVYQRCQADANRFAEIVVPIVLPEVQIERPGQRAEYVRAWKKQAADLDKLLKELGTDFGNDGFNKTRLAKDIARHAADILFFVNDILMPRNLKGLFDSDFEPVIEALLRRLKKAVAG
jgi:internalin A